MEEPLLEQTGSAQARSLWRSASSRCKAVVDEEPGMLRAAKSLRRLDSILNKQQTAVLYGSSVEKAAALVDQAIEGKGIPPEHVGQPGARDALRCYALYRQFSDIFFLNSVVLLLLSFFEIPLWCKGDISKPCGDSNMYLLSKLPFFSRPVCLSIEAICIVIMCFQVYLQRQYRGVKSGPPLVRTAKIVVLVILILETTALAGVLTVRGSTYYPSVRLNPYARILAVVFLDSDVTKFFGLVLSVMARFIDQGMLVVLFVLFSAWIGRTLFLGTTEGELYFNSLRDAAANMFYLITAVNSPEVWIPAYQQNPVLSVFFIAFLFLGMYILMGVLFGVVFASYKEKVADDIAAQLYHRSENLKMAFDLLDADKDGYLSLDIMCKLLEALRGYLKMPSIDLAEMAYMFSALDTSGDFRLDIEEFEDVISVISLEFEPVEPGGFIQRNFPRVYNCSALRKLREFVKSDSWSNMIFCILAINGVIIGVETELEAVGSPYQRPMQILEVVFSWIYFAEMVLEIFAYGFNMYWRSGVNRFGFVTTWLMISVQLLVFQVIPNHIADLHWIRYMLVLQLLRLAECLSFIKHYMVVIKSAYHVLPALKPLMGMLFCLLMIYNTFAVQAYGGLMRVDSPELKGTKYLSLNYLPHNFNDFPTGMITMFDLMVGHNWSVFMDAYVRLSGTEWTRVFFVSFFILAVTFSVKLVLALILAGFMSQMKALQAEGSSKNLTKAKSYLNKNGLRVKVVAEPSKKSNVELLKEILSSEVKAAEMRQKAKELNNSKAATASPQQAGPVTTEREITPVKEEKALRGLFPGGSV